MKFVETELPGVFIIELSPKNDERGFFASTFLREEFSARGLETAIAQTAISFSPLRGTLRGIHYQVPPHEEAKLVRCARGAIYDVLVDIRDDSPTRGHWIAIELSARNRRSIYIPRGIAHGYQTTEDETEVLYQISTPYIVSATRGIRWDDAALAIPWPPGPRTISERDRSLGALNLVARHAPGMPERSSSDA